MKFSTLSQMIKIKQEIKKLYLKKLYKNLFLREKEKFCYLHANGTHV